MPPPKYALDVIREGVGKRILALNERLWAGKVHHVDAFELWLIPTSAADPVQRLVFVGRLPSGDTVVLETTAELFRAACRELEEH